MISDFLGKKKHAVIMGIPYYAIIFNLIFFEKQHIRLNVATRFEHLQFYIFTSLPWTLIRTTRNEVKTDRIIRVQTAMFGLINSIHRELMFLGIH